MKIVLFGLFLGIEDDDPITPRVLGFVAWSAQSRPVRWLRWVYTSLFQSSVDCGGDRF